MSSFPLVSVVVPVYNCERYLSGCLVSLKNQTLSNIEIILVDDGSDDSSANICESYARDDERFRVVHQDNAGVSAARNKGISLAKGKYVMFVDSDDSVEPQFCELPCRIAEEQDLDLVVFRFNLWSNEPLIIGGPAGQYSGLKTSKEALSQFFYADVYIWNKLYRRELFEGITFPNVNRYEEHGVTHRLLHAADRIYFTDAVLYNYYVRGKGLSSKFTVESENDRFRLVRQQVEDFQNWGLSDLAFERQMRAAVRYLVKVGRKGLFSKESEAVFSKKTDPLPFFSKKENMLHSLFCVSPILFDLACRIGKKRLGD